MSAPVTVGDLINDLSKMEPMYRKALIAGLLSNLSEDDQCSAISAWAGVTDSVLLDALAHCDREWDEAKDVYVEDPDSAYGFNRPRVGAHSPYLQMDMGLIRSTMPGIQGGLEDQESTAEKSALENPWQRLAKTQHKEFFWWMICMGGGFFVGYLIATLLLAHFHAGAK